LWATGLALLHLIVRANLPGASPVALGFQMVAVLTALAVGVHALRPAPKAVVLGDHELASAADAGGRRVVAVLPLDADPGTFPDHDELVVSEGSYGALQRAGVELGSPSRSVVLARDAEPLSTAFAPAIPLAGATAKRILDILGAAAGLLLFAPLLLVVALAVRLDSRGPALFVQHRVGRDGKQFRLCKFRTMTVGNDDSAHREYVTALIKGEAGRVEGMYKLANDTRITRLGRILRRYSIDELPQLWNVLTGRMSLVGPRPALPSETVLYSPDMWERLRVKPGLTGLWQVSGRCELGFNEMLGLDVEYWKGWTLRRDLRILLMTPMVVVTARGAA
jgi:lipopolysaccharide/colanic/teichoic acid biosynthesis glycosyltransferase